MKASKISLFALFFLCLAFSGCKKASPAVTEPLRHPLTVKNLKEELFRLLRGLEIQSFVDIPCGEVSWIEEIRPFIQIYTGVDAHEKVVQKNREKYGSYAVRFQNLEISKDPLPKADLIFCHDALNLLSQQEIAAALVLFKKSGAKYLLLSTFPVQEKNHKGKKGFYHPINWQLPPYQFPKPLLLLNDPNEKQKKLALWRMDDL